MSLDEATRARQQMLNSIVKCRARIMTAEKMERIFLAAPHDRAGLVAMQRKILTENREHLSFLKRIMENDKS